ncbi:hypothetical protein GQ607_009750 [Colletotrichum asianum]|uniref:Uncharacterized protein n=1 Tax=Colletotrichum asianum TaxID=702518 RepID=A0A8H3ZPI8_9PEZI|nr:hypothetical protein GQ607_009750 [Colletotrichum asianum]
MAPFKEAKLLSATTYFGSTTVTNARPISRPLNREALFVTKPRESGQRNPLRMENRFITTPIIICALLGFRYDCAIVKATKERMKDIFVATSGDDPFVRKPQTPLPKTQTMLSNAECTLTRLFHYLS